MWGRVTKKTQFYHWVSTIHTCRMWDEYLSYVNYHPGFRKQSRSVRTVAVWACPQYRYLFPVWFEMASTAVEGTKMFTVTGKQGASESQNLPRLKAGYLLTPGANMHLSKYQFLKMVNDINLLTLVWAWNEMMSPWASR